MKHPRLTLLAATLALAAVLSACSGGSSEAELMASARGYLEKKDLAAATIQLKAALQKNPGNGEARLLLGRSLLDSGDAAGAAIELRKALELGAKPADAQPPLARAMLGQGQAREVVLQFAEVRLDDPLASADLKTTVATAQAAQGARDKAVATLLSALQDAPDHIPAILLHARIKAAERDLPGTLALVDQALAKDGKHFGALMFKAELQRYGQRDRAAALATYVRAQEAHPKLPQPQAAIVAMLMEERKFEDARARFKQLQEQHPKFAETLLFEAQFAYIDRNHARTRELTDQLLKAFPDDLRVLQLAGVNELRLNSPTRAEKHLSKVLQARPHLAAPRQLLARIYTRTGQPGKALELLRPLTDSPAADAGSLTLAGEALLQMGDMAKAEAVFARAAKADPKATTARTALALAQVARGQEQEGLAELEAVAAADSGTRADLALIAARLRSRDVPGAMKAIDALEKKQPASPLPHALRASTLMQSKDTAAATASFEKALKIDPLYYPAVAGLASIELAAGRPEGAQKYFDKLLEADPGNARALLGLAELKARTGGTKDEVTAAITRAVTANPTEIGPRRLLVNHLLAQRDAKAALAAAQDAVAALPDSVEAMGALGTAQLAAGEPQQAVSTFSRIASLRPDQAGPELQLAEAHAAAKDHAAARRSLNKVLQMTTGVQPGQRVLAQVALAQLALREDQPDEALRIARNVQKAEPKSRAGYVLEADVELGRKAYGAAVEPLRKALQFGGGTEVAVKLHAALSADKQTASAERFAANWLKEHPRDVGFRYYQGDAAMARRDLAAAESHYRQVLEIQPKHAPALNNVAWLMAQQKKQGALALAEQANQLLPNQPALMDTLAYALALEKQPQRAIEVQRKAMALAPQNHGLRLTLAKIYLESGDRAKAKTELETLAKLGQDYAGQAEVSKLLATL